MWFGLIACMVQVHVHVHVHVRFVEKRGGTDG